MKKFLVSFGTPDYFGSLELLAMSAGGQVDGMFLIKSGDIPEGFYRENIHIFSQKRGFGYWLWKPFILNEIIGIVEEGDVIIYCDSASIITNPLKNLFDLCDNGNGAVLFENMNGSYSDPWVNRNWTKADCFNLMDCQDSRYYDGKQVDAAFQIYKKNDFTVKLLREYLNFSLNENILTDIQNISGENSKDFIDHRHDQSILSLLAIKHGVNLKACPSQWRKGEADFPITFFHHKKKINFE